MESFAHLFEFLAGINSAYIVSDHFLKSLIEKVFKPFHELDNRTHSCRQIWNNTNDKLIDIASNLKPADRAELAKSSSVIERNLDTLEADVKTIKELGGISENFSFISLYGAMYSILLLILIGFEINFHDNYFVGISFTIFNIVSIILLFWLLVRTKKRWIFKNIIPSYSVVIFTFLVSILITIIVGFFIFRMNYFKEHDTEFPKIWYVINSLIAILIPTSHYIYYSIVSRNRTKLDVRNKMNIANQLLRDVELLANTIQVHSGYASRDSISIAEKNS